MAAFDDMRSELGPRPGPKRLVGFYSRLTGDLLGRIRPERARTARRNRGGSGNCGDPDRYVRGLGLAQLIEGVGRDLRMAARSLARNPLFLLVAVLSLAIGIGANTAIFSAVNAVFIKQYPYRAPDELVRVFTRVPDRTEYGTTSFPNYRDMRDLDQWFQTIGAFKTLFSRMELEDETVRVLGEGVSHTLFPMLGVEAAIGRSFYPEEDETPGAHPVMVLGHGFWQRAFGGSLDVVGRNLRLAGRSFTVVGIAPEGFHGLTGAGLSADFFVPLVMYGAASGLTDNSHFEDRLDRRYFVVGRVAEGVSLETAGAGLELFSRQIREANPQIEQEWAFSMLPIEDVALDPDIDRAVQPFAVLLMAAGGLVLLLACTNLASFLLARGTDRRKEIALRLALGAGRGSLVRQLLTEAVLLAFLGGTAGLLAAHWTLGLLSRFQPPLPVPITLDLGLDRTVLAFALGISALAGLVFGLAPALRSTNPALSPALKDEAGVAHGRRFGLRNGLVAAQVAMSVVLLVTGSLFVRSLGAARDADLGFSTRDAGIVLVDLAISGVPAAEYRLVTEELTQRARALPGIEAVTAASHIPFLFSASGGFYSIPGLEPPARGTGYNVQREEVDLGFFKTMGIPLTTGRNFSAEDRPQAPRVAIVNETASRLFWPGESPVDKEFFPVGSEESIRVVGVVGDTKVDRLREPPKPLFYFPIAQRPDPDLILVARGRSDPPEITAMLRAMIHEANPQLVIMDAKTMEENIGVVLFPARMAALLLGAFGVLALALATIGLYGVVSYSVSRRTPEVGIRLALGADPRAVVAMVMRGAMGLTAIGGVVGLAAAFGLAQLLRSVLYGVSPWDPAAIIGATLLLGCVAALAALLPARRASRVDPVEALRHG